MDATETHEGDAVGSLTRRFIGRLTAALWTSCGLLVALAGTYVRFPPGASRFGVVMVGLAAVAIGFVIWPLPWERWGRAATLWVAPPAFALIALHDHFSANDGYVYAALYFVVFTWLGLAHPPGTSLRFSPMLAAAYVLPLVVGEVGRPVLGIASALYVIPICVLVGETVAWVGGRLRRSEAALVDAQERFRSSFEQAPIGMALASGDGRLMRANRAFATIVGRDVNELVGTSIRNFTHPDDWETNGVKMRALFAGEIERYQIEKRYLHADGHEVWVSVSASCVKDPAGWPSYMIGQIEDITERKLAVVALAEAEERFHRTFENAPIGMALTRLDGVFMSVNPACGKIVGRDPRSLEGTNIRDLTHLDDWADGAAKLEALLTGEIDGYSTEKRYMHADGHVVWVSVSASCVRGSDNAPLYMIRQVEDITERREMRERLAHAAGHDLLTGLPNRVLFMDRLELSLQRSERDGHLVAVMFLDLDRFKLVNDSLGHDAGDRLLCEVAQQLMSVLRTSDTLARFGGDEFTVLCEVTDRAEALEIAGRLVAAMERPLHVPGSEHYVSISLGLAFAEDRCNSGADLLRNADYAMFQAKEAGPGHLEVYERDGGADNVHRLRTSNELHRALERGEMELYYQPVVDLHTRTMVGLEALVRWRHPTRGLLLPCDFVPLAEDSGLIVPLGRWVLGEACQQAALWHARRGAAGAEDARLSMAINVSARQLADEAFPRTVASALTESGLDPERLWLEITESTLMSHGESMMTRLSSLRELGVHFAIDDFGTGYSSLSYLKQFPVETLKIDRSFVDEIDHNSGDIAIARAIIALGDSLGLTVIAEGVERQSQADELRALGCFLAQGYLFGHPEPARSLDPFPTDDLSAWHPHMLTTA